MISGEPIYEELAQGGTPLSAPFYGGPTVSLTR